MVLAFAGCFSSPRPSPQRISQTPFNVRQFAVVSRVLSAGGCTGTWQLRPPVVLSRRSPTKRTSLCFACRQGRLSSSTRALGMLDRSLQGCPTWTSTTSNLATPMWHVPNPLLASRNVMIQNTHDSLRASQTGKRCYYPACVYSQHFSRGDEE